MLFELGNQALTLQILALSQIESLCAISWALCLPNVSFSSSVSLSFATLQFTRMEKRTRDPPSNYLPKYRDTFENGYTRIFTSAARSTSHYHVVRYEFAAQTILLRYAVDAYRGGFAEVLMQANGIEDTDSGPLVRRHRNMI